MILWEEAEAEEAEGVSVGSDAVFKQCCLFAKQL